MNIRTLFRQGKHRLDPRRHHNGWKGHELRLLAPHDDTETTRPIRGLPVPEEQLLRDCPLDMCAWPHGAYATQAHDQHIRLLQHIIEHNAMDVVRTCYRQQRAIEKLQALT